VALYSVAGIAGAELRERLRRTIGGAIDAAAKRLGTTDRRALVVHPVDRDEAVARARWHVTATYNLAGESDSLEVIEDEHSGGSWRLRLRAPNATTYDVELLESNDLVAMTLVRRRLHDDELT
jgi:hypothetical protein